MSWPVLWKQDEENPPEYLSASAVEDDQGARISILVGIDIDQELLSII